MRSLSLPFTHYLSPKESLRLRRLPHAITSCRRPALNPTLARDASTYTVEEKNAGLTTTSPRPLQIYPLKGYYAQHLKYPTHPAKTKRWEYAVGAPTTSAPPSDQPSSSSSSPSSSGTSFATSKISSTDDLTPSEKFGVVFGTRLASPGYSSTRYQPSKMQHLTPDATWKKINGYQIPPRPAEPDNCCMTGCVNCVWDNYRDDLEEWAGLVKEAKRRKPARAEQNEKARTIRQGMPFTPAARADANDTSISMDDDGGGSETNWSPAGMSGGGDDEDDMYSGIPVGITEFMKTEKKLKQAKQAKNARQQKG